MHSMETSDQIKQFFSNKKVQVTSIISGMILSGTIGSFLAFFFIKWLFVGPITMETYLWSSEIRLLTYAGIAHGFITGLVLLSSIIISIHLIIKGKSEGRNAKRNLGIGILAVPIGLFLAFASLIYAQLSGIFQETQVWAFLSIHFLAFVLTIIGIFYAFKLNAKIALIPLISMPILAIIAQILVFSIVALFVQIHFSGDNSPFSFGYG